MFNWYATQRIETQRLEEERLKVRQDFLVRQTPDYNQPPLRLHQRLLTSLGTWMVSAGCRLQSRYDHILSAKQASYLTENDPFVTC